MEWVKKILLIEASKIKSSEGREFLRDLGQESVNVSLEKYQKLLEKKSSQDFEEQLKREIPSELFSSLSLPRHVVPQIHRPLPTLNDLYENQIEQIPTHFLKYRELKKGYIDKAVTSLYPTNIRGRVVLFTHVLKDGLGDLSAQGAAAQVLKENCPHIELEMITLLPSSVHVEFSHNPLILKYQDESGLAPSGFPEEAWDMLSRANLILQINTIYPYWEELQKTLRMKGMQKFETLGEYGFSASPQFYQDQGSRCMGLHFLEKGIFIQKKGRIGGELEDRTLAKKLFQGRSIEEYRAKRHLHLAYLRTKERLSQFIDALLTYYEEDQKGIDLVFQNIQCLLGVLETEYQEESNPFPLFAQMGIRQIEIHNGNDRFLLAVSPRGKTVRFFPFETLSPSDFQKLLHLSGPLFGCRGNQSFSEGVSAGKWIFYEEQPHTRLFFKDLVALAENRLSKGVVDYLKAHQDPILGGRKMGQLLKEKGVSSDLEKLGEILRQEYPVNPYLSSLVGRGLLHLQFPDIADREEKLINQFLDKEIDFSLLISGLKTILGNLEFV